MEVLRYVLEVKTPYRSRQYYGYKVLHNIEVVWFLTAHFSLKMHLFIQTATECNVVAPFNALHLTPSKLKLANSLFQNQLLVSLRIAILVNFEAKWPKTWFL